jgi:hypothetical protein
MRTTVKIALVAAAATAMLAAGVDAYAQSDRQRRKALENQFKAKKKEFAKEDWKITGTAKTLDVALIDYYDKLRANDNNYEIVGEVSVCQSINVCKQAALNNAITEYANRAGSHVKGRIASDANLDQTSGQGEFDKMYGAYIRNVEAEVKGILQSGFSVVREKDGSRAYKTYFIIDETEASKARVRAIENAAKETKLAQEYATKISDFVREGFAE